MKTLVIVDYGMGNLTSVTHALDFLGYKGIISSRTKDIEDADALIMPGVGCFSEAMRNLNELDIIPILHEKVVKNQTPFFGICLGMQLLAEDSVENGFHKGLGWISGHVVRFEHKDDIRIPHVGWNTINVIKKKFMFGRIEQNAEFYFDHSYHFVCDREIATATCSYGTDVVAAIQKNNIFATQFHPEKSQVNGLKVLRGFLNFVESFKGTGLC
ncbi:MAG: imidazole glycerol phosphate synthase subunit [Candidatus Scalindua rubra]|uniref:Imidazole glycerol phosphate synthase subunit HisH n=1 Tax=Candidatus Scalindua rubra TaxID=1872076 RepID=A0A1E3XDQ0_9BACT|nr:MAG: imidazole glycerol phosphate synthase subunit [Candidatus Scalindua rubra]